MFLFTSSVLRIGPRSARWRLLGAALCATQSAVAAEPAQELRATQDVCLRGPSHSVAAAQTRTGDASVVAAGVLPNPSIVASHQETLTGVTDRETIVGLSVPIGVGGRYFLLQDAAQARSEQATATASATLLDAGLDFRVAYAKAVLDQARLETRIKHQETLDQLSAIIEGREKSGEASGYDLSRQQMQARLHHLQVQTAQGEAQASRTRLDGWLSEPLELAKPDPTTLGNFGAPQPLDVSSATPRIRSLRAEARASTIEGRAARRRWVPDIQVSAGYRGVGIGSSTGHGISLGLTVPLTFFDHGQGEAAVADAAQATAEAEAERVLREQDAVLRAARSRLAALEQAVVEAEVATVEAGELEMSVQRLYRAGEVTITELLEALQNVETARLSKFELAEELVRARLAVMRASGTMFNETLDRACGVAGKAR